MKIVQKIFDSFLIPLLILVGLGVYGFLMSQNLIWPALIVIWLMIALGSYQLFIEIVRSILRRQFALDYIAVLALVVSLGTGHEFVAGIIALMLSTGQHLEAFGFAQAKKNLTALINRLPSQIPLMQDGKIGETVNIAEVKIGQNILIRKGQVVALDGILISAQALLDESSLTGEPYLFDKISGDTIRSGVVNMGEPITIRVTREEADSTYKKIIQMVESAQEEKAPLVRLADRYSVMFTVITLSMCAVTYFFTADVTRVLAILVIATPCPLILATPIALMGGVNACAKRRIIVKKLSALEVLSRIDTLIFDKTGTITIGRPSLTALEIVDLSYTKAHILSCAAAIERNSLHPLAKAIVEYAASEKVPLGHARQVKEEIGTGISGEYEGVRYLLAKGSGTDGMMIVLSSLKGSTETPIAHFRFEDSVKPDTVRTLHHLKSIGLRTLMFTGDKQEAAERVLKTLNLEMELKANCTPEDKLIGVQELKRDHRVVAMVGDGINDAPALALADVGMVFSNEEATASSEAADIVFLGGDFTQVLDAVELSRGTVKIALQSIRWGIGLSLVGMVFGAYGVIVPIVGAVLQECIDVAVIVNALRASK